MPTYDWEDVTKLCNVLVYFHIYKYFKILQNKTKQIQHKNKTTHNSMYHNVLWMHFNKQLITNLSVMALSKKVHFMCNNVDIPNVCTSVRSENQRLRY